MDRGFWLSIEAALALCLLAVMLLSFNFPDRASPERALMVLKESDLLAEWTKGHKIELEEMLMQAKELFPDNFVELESGGSKVSCCYQNKRKEEKISVMGLIVTESGTEKIILSVFE